MPEIHLDADIHTAIVELAERSGETPSAVLRRLLQAQGEPRTRRRNLSFHYSPKDWPDLGHLLRSEPFVSSAMPHNDS